MSKAKNLHRVPGKKMTRRGRTRSNLKKVDWGHHQGL